ncbi:hypothetical protein [Candidatus Tisiphia endosymbiont of Parasteatoda lunata]|uniref:hypothetical protein n=1 Tax=Candidatus Tisiphia endosymbiont of Parasteatoda lunata TaxID=3066275 RepID=UPI00313BB429
MLSYIFSFDRQAKEVIYDNFLFYTKSKGQALMVSLVKLVAYLSLSYIETQYLYNGRNLKIDGEDVRQFINHHTALRFVNEGSEILSAVNFIQHSRDELIKIFKRAANLLREDGLQAGLDRFGAFSDILFLKILDEISVLKMLGGARRIH